MAKSTSSGRIWVWGLVALLVLLIGAASAGWFARKPVAEKLIANWCAARNLTCQMDIAHLGTDRVEIHNIVISGPTIPDLLSARQLTALVDWPGLFSPKFSRVDLLDPAIKARFDGERLTMDGLEDLASSNSGAQSDLAIPIINTSGGRLSLDTPAGELTGTFSTSGQWPDAGHAELVFARTDLATGDDHLQLDAGSLSVQREPSGYSGQLDLQVSSLRLNQTRARNLNINAELRDDADPILTWDIVATELDNPDYGTLQGGASTGRAVLKTTNIVSRPSIDDVIREIETTITANLLRWQSYQAVELQLAGRAETTADARLDLTLSTELSEAESDTLSAGSLRVDLQGRVSPQTWAFSGQGEAFLAAARLAPAKRQAWLGVISSASPFDHHAATLRTALDTGLSDFSSGARFRLEVGHTRDWQLIIPERLALNTASGGAMVMSAEPGRSALTLQPQTLTLAGILTLSGGQLPRLSADIRRLQRHQGQWNMQIGGVELNSWRANGLALSAKLNRLDAQTQDQGMRLSGVGELGFDGQVLGVKTEQARIFGGIEAAQGPAGWRIQTVEQACLGLAAKQASASETLVVRDIGLNICPENGRFIQQENGLASGTIQLGDFALPFTGKDISGTAAFNQAEINWTAGENLAIRIRADQLDMPMQIGSRDLKLQTSNPRLGLEFGTITQLNALLEQTHLSGGLVPANVAIESADFSGTIAANRFRATANAQNVDLTDYREDALYNPMRAQISAVFTGPDLSLSGPISLKSTGQKIGSADLSLNLLSLDGQAQMRTEDLIFDRRGLQPKHLSDRVRGLLSNGRGQLNAVTNFTIDSGKIAGTGLIKTSEFGFDTQRIGAIDGISGEIHFSDMIALTTEPGQKLTFAHINPGIPLNDGELSLQLMAGKRILIEGARWPLAGGSIELQPAEWTIGAKTEELMIDATAIELSELIEVLSLPDMKAEGTISGSFPLTLEDGNAWVRDAFFLADEKGGTISYTGTAAEQAGQADDRVAAAFTALRNLKFKVLEVGVDGNLIDDITVSARLLGHNPQVYGGAEFDFRISVESKLAQLIRSGQRLAAARWIADAVAVDPDAETDDPFN